MTGTVEPTAWLRSRIRLFPHVASSTRTLHVSSRYLTFAFMTLKSWLILAGRIDLSTIASSACSNSLHCQSCAKAAIMHFTFVISWAFPWPMPVKRRVAATKSIASGSGRLSKLPKHEVCSQMTTILSSL